MNAYSPPNNWKRGRLRAQRVPISMSASIMTISAYQFPELADISQSGVKLRGSPLPTKGTTALLRAGPLEVLCRVIWVRDEECGLRFEEPVSPKTLKQIQLDGAVELNVCKDEDIRAL